MRASVFLVLGAALCGCDGAKSDAPTGKPPVHEHHAAHGGALQVLGDEAAHVELVFEPKSGRLTAFVLDGEAENPVRIAQETLRLKIKDVDETVELKAVASPLTGEKVGDTSQFEGRSGKLSGLAKFEATLETITARGVRFDAVAIGYPGGNEHEEKPDVRK